MTMVKAKKSTSKNSANQARGDHVYFFLKITIQEGILNIHLRCIPLTNRSNDNKSTNSSHLCNRSKGLLIIYIILLRKPLSNQLNLVSLNQTIRLSFDCIDPVRTNGTLPSINLMQNIKFLSHSLLPKRIKNNFSIW